MQLAGEGRIPHQDVIDFADEFDISEDAPLFGVDPREVPSVTVASQPGDVVFFNMYCCHATFGGRTGRRMFTMNFAVHPTTDDQIALFRRHLEIGLKSHKVMQHGESGRIYPEYFLACERPRIKRMVRRLNEWGLQ